MEKICYVCGESKPLDAFGNRPFLGTPYYFDKCNACIQRLRKNRERIRQHLKAHPDESGLYGKCGRDDVRLVRRGWDYVSVLEESE